MVSIIDKLEADPAVGEADYHPSENLLTVTHDYFGNTEVTLIREGKLTPLESTGESIQYDVHITLGEQQDNRESKFNFV